MTATPAAIASRSTTSVSCAIARSFTRRYGARTLCRRCGVLPHQLQQRVDVERLSKPRARAELCGVALDVRTRAHDDGGHLRRERMRLVVVGRVRAIEDHERRTRAR